MQLTKEQEMIMVLAEAAYVGYCKHTNNKSIITGQELPSWGELQGEVKNAWFASTVNVLDCIRQRAIG